MARQAALRLVKSISSPAIVDTIAEYLLTKRQEGRSPETIKQYELRLRQFAKWLDERGVMRLNDLSRLLLREWGVSLNPGWSPATTRHTIVIVNGFLNWCVSEGLITDDPGKSPTGGGQLTTALRVPKARRRIQRVLSDDEIGRLLDTCDGTMFGLRDAAIVSLMIDSGLRASEVCRLKISDLIFDFPLGHTPSGTPKGRKLVNFIPIIMCNHTLV